MTFEVGDLVAFKCDDDSNSLAMLYGIVLELLPPDEIDDVVAITWLSWPTRKGIEIWRVHLLNKIA